MILPILANEPGWFEDPTHWIALLSFIMSILGIPTLVAMFWNSNSKKAKEKKDKIESYEKQQHDIHISEMINKDLDKKLDEKLKPVNEKLDSLQKDLGNVHKDINSLKQADIDLKKDLTITKTAIQAQLRHDIRNACRRCIEQGYRTEEDTTEVEKMHNSYQDLGTNGVTNRLYDDFVNLPIKAKKGDK